MRRKRRRVLWPLAAFLVALAVFLVAFARGLAPVGPGARPVIVVRDGETVAAVLHRLESHHAIRSARWARVYGWLWGVQGRRLVPGLYQVSPVQSTPQILSGLVGRLGAVERITIPEGRNARWIAALLDRKRICTRAEFLGVSSNPAVVASSVSFRLPSSSLEGYLFPDTYYMAQNVGARAAAAMMLQNFERRTIAAGVLPSASIDKVVIVASMVELEAKLPKDRALIAGVIANRLKKNMPLEIDAAVLYGLGEWKDRVLIRDLRQDTPYNTYRHPGLPPTPICNPGIPSLLAAAKPATHQYLYYVARGDGSHAFSVTYAEHLRNKRRAQQERAQAH